jgi:hypothetical protein
MGNKIPTWCENKFYFMKRNYLFVRAVGGLADGSKTNFKSQEFITKRGKDETTKN